MTGSLPDFFRLFRFSRSLSGEEADRLSSRPRMEQQLMTTNKRSGVEPLKMRKKRGKLQKVRAKTEVSAEKTGNLEREGKNDP